MGKIIQITSAGNDGGIMLYALCDDGRLWEFCHQTGWFEVPLPIPSQNRDYAKLPVCPHYQDGECNNHGGDCFYCAGNFA